MSRFITSIMAVVALGTLAAGQRASAAPRGATVTITSLVCNTSVEGDIEVRVYSGPREIYKSRRFMKKGTVWKFTERQRSLANDMRIEVWKINKGLFAKDHKVGSVLIKRGNKTGKFVSEFNYFERGVMGPFAAAGSTSYLLRFRVDG
jgi:hypothetical protein